MFGTSVLFFNFLCKSEPFICFGINTFTNMPPLPKMRVKCRSCKKKYKRFAFWFPLSTSLGGCFLKLWHFFCIFCALPVRKWYPVLFFFEKTRKNELYMFTREGLLISKKLLGFFFLGLFFKFSQLFQYYFF